MTDAAEATGAGWRLKLSAFSLATAIFVVLWFMIAALGTNWGWWSWQAGLGQMTLGIGAPIAFFSVALSLLASIIALYKAPRFQPLVIALIASLIGWMCLLRLVGMQTTFQSLPPIHDIQTDWSDPIQYTERLLAARKADGNTNPVLDAPTIEGDRVPEALVGRLVSEVQEEAETRPAGKGTVYPPMRTLYFDQSPVELAALAEKLVKRRGWKIVTQAATEDTGEEIQIEATAESSWFGFKDDVAIRISPVEGGCMVDMRSISRVGLSDLGANAKRVSGFMNELLDRGDGRIAP